MWTPPNLSVHPLSTTVCEVISLCLWMTHFVFLRSSIPVHQFFHCLGLLRIPVFILFVEWMVSSPVNCCANGVSLDLFVLSVSYVLFPLLDWGNLFRIAMTFFLFYGAFVASLWHVVDVKPVLILEIDFWPASDTGVKKTVLLSVLQFSCKYCLVLDNFNVLSNFHCWDRWWWPLCAGFEHYSVE